MRAAGIPVPEGRIVADAEEAVAVAGEIGLPVALKLSSAAVQHKSDVGALELGLGDERTLREAHGRLAALEVAAEAEILIERMVEPGLEVIVAARGDAVVPALVIGLGGVWAEALDDVSIVPLPAEPGAGRAGDRGSVGSAAADRRARTGAARRHRPGDARRPGRRPAARRAARADRAQPRRRPPAGLRSPRRPGALMSAAIETVGVVGAGFMGSGIAESAARAGLPVFVQEPSPEPLERSREQVERSVGRAVEGGKLESAEAASPDRGDHLDQRARGAHPMRPGDRGGDRGPGGQGGGLLEARCDLAEDSIIASNTSSIPIAQLAAATARRERVIGLHFFSPVPVMKLVELVVGIDTSAETVERCEAFAERIGKRPIRTKDRSGFIVNMLLVPYLMAGVRMYEEGFAEREAIDEAMRLGCGHPMGPLELADFVGLDVLYAVCDSLFEEFKRPEYAPPPLMKRMVVSGHLGRKTGRGFYEYD